MAVQAALNTPLPQSDATLKMLTTLLQDDLDQVNTLILDKSQSPVHLISELAKHLIAAGGKRIRPVLTLACAKLYEYEGVDHIKLATAVEFIHTATLLHDDVVDESDLRRGQKTANNVWGNEASVLVGDFLFSQAFKLMVETKSLDALDALSSASAIIAQGEVKQLLATCDLRTSPETYYEIIDAKTAALFKSACQVGPIITNQSVKAREALGDYGRNLGLLFQITDDILDYCGSTSVMGKSIGDDFKEGKITLPIILTYKQASTEEKEFLLKCFKNLSQVDSDFNKTVHLMHQKNIFSQCFEIAEEYGAQAKTSLKKLPQNEISAHLDGLVDYCLSRIS